MFRIILAAFVVVLLSFSLNSTALAQSASPNAEQIIRKLDRSSARSQARGAPRHSVREIKRNRKLRGDLPSIDIQSINFRFGSAEIGRSEFWKISEIADALRHFQRRNPGELFLLEGHTDAVGTRRANHRLSIQRARSLRRVLVRHFGVDPYSLDIEGYGEEFMLVYTQAPEWRNRRVTIRRLTGYYRQ